MEHGWGTFALKSILPSQFWMQWSELPGSDRGAKKKRGFFISFAIDSERKYPPDVE